MGTTRINYSHLENEEFGVGGGDAVFPSAIDSLANRHGYSVCGGHYYDDDATTTKTTGPLAADNIPKGTGAATDDDTVMEESFEAMQRLGLGMGLSYHRWQAARRTKR